MGLGRELCLKLQDGLSHRNLHGRLNMLLLCRNWLDLSLSLRHPLSFTPPGFSSVDFMGLFGLTNAQINIPPAVYSCNLAHETEILLPPRYDTFQTQVFGVDLSRLMGADGSRGLPRPIIDVVTYLGEEGPPLHLPRNTPS